MPFECFTKCYNAIQSTLDYGAAVYGTNSYSCLEAVQNRACRYYLGLGKYAPNLAINGDMGWDTPQNKQWICVIRKWCRMINMDNTRLTKILFLSCFEQSNSRCRTWFYRVTQFLCSIDHQYICHTDTVHIRSVLASVKTKLKSLHEVQWRDKLNSDVAKRGASYGGNKLRTYRTFKQSYSTEPYVRIITHKRYRSAYAKFRCGVAPIKLETCRYGLNRVPVEERLCEDCGVIEDEFHVLMVCPTYNDIRHDTVNSICTLSNQFTELSLENQFIQIMSDPMYYKIVSKFLYSILNKRRYIQFL